MPAPIPAPWVRPRPPKPTRPPPPPPKDAPYELKQAFRGTYRSFQINDRSRMDVETLLRETRGSVAHLMSRDLLDLDAMKA